MILRVVHLGASVVVPRMLGMRIWGRRWPNFLCRWRRGPTQPRREKQICENWPLITANQANNTPRCKMMYMLSLVLELSANSYLHCVDMKSWWCCKDGRECRIFHYAHFRCLPTPQTPQDATTTLGFKFSTFQFVRSFRWDFVNFPNWRVVEVVSCLLAHNQKSWLLFHFIFCAYETIIKWEVYRNLVFFKTLVFSGALPPDVKNISEIFISTNDLNKRLKIYHLHPWKRQK